MDVRLENHVDGVARGPGVVDGSTGRNGPYIEATRTDTRSTTTAPSGAWRTTRLAFLVAFEVFVLLLDFFADFFDDVAFDFLAVDLRTVVFFFGDDVAVTDSLPEGAAGSPATGKLAPKRKTAARAAAGMTDALRTKGIIRRDRGAVNPKNPWGSMIYADSAYPRYPRSR